VYGWAPGVALDLTPRALRYFSARCPVHRARTLRDLLTAVHAAKPGELAAELTRVIDGMPAASRANAAAPQGEHPQMALARLAEALGDRAAARRIRVRHEAVEALARVREAANA